MTEPTQVPSDQPAPDTSAAEAAAVDAAFLDTSSLDSALQTLKAERDQFFDNWKRSQAEFDNIRKRMQRELEQAAKYESLPIIRDILPGLDNLRRTLDAANKNGKLDELTKGVEMTLKQFEEILGRHNATPAPGVGTPFDPHIHQAIQQVPSAEHPPMTVLMEVERGYLLHDRVVRPSKVIVSAAPPAT